METIERAGEQTTAVFNFARPRSLSFSIVSTDREPGTGYNSFNQNLELQPNGLLEHTGYRVRSLVVRHPVDSSGAQDGGFKILRTFSRAMHTPVISISMPVSIRII